MDVISTFHQVGPFEWELPTRFRADMLVPVRFFATRELLKAASEDQSIEQAVNASALPGLAGPVVVMPDVHQGYGFPIGGVAAFLYPEGMISPGAIGYDINCGVRLLASDIPLQSVRGSLDALATALDHFCPSGVGAKSALRLSRKELEKVCRDGSEWALKQGYARAEDLNFTEESGRLEGADPRRVSERAFERALPQLGSLGSGNHFIEIEVVDQVFDPVAARAMGLTEGNLTVQIHCGSRGFGHQICTDFVQAFQGLPQRYGIHLADRELVCAPLDSKEGQAYLAAMRCAANYAFVNRQILADAARRAFEAALAGKVKHFDLRQVYDIAHNLAKIEIHDLPDGLTKVCMHRKGATRAFGPHSEGLPEQYREIGQPVLVPGSMGTASWVLTGSAASAQLSYGSCCHGAGRVMSRARAKKVVHGDELRRELEGEGIHVRAGSLSGLAEEAPQAYKDVDAVVETVVGAGIAKKVARLRPVAVIKG